MKLKLQSSSLAWAHPQVTQDLSFNPFLSAGPITFYKTWASQNLDQSSLT